MLMKTVKPHPQFVSLSEEEVLKALDAYEAALSDCPRKDHRHIIIHADLIPRPMIERAAKMGISVMMFALPALFVLASFFVFILKYKLDDAKMAEVNRVKHEKL